MKKIVKTALEVSPRVQITDGVNAAKILMEIVQKNNWFSEIKGKKYLHFEAWQTLGRFYGYTVKIVETNYVEYGQAKGFNAKAIVIDKNGKEVGGAEAICMNDEEDWKGKDKGLLYSIKSMAQTRAGSKALRLILSWVAVLAGYEATPAEEINKSMVKQKALPAESMKKLAPYLNSISMAKTKNDMAKIVNNIKKLQSVKNVEKKLTNNELDYLRNAWAQRLKQILKK